MLRPMTSERAIEQGVWTGHIDENGDLDIAQAEDVGQTKVEGDIELEDVDEIEVENECE
jgi:hypothetical protein